jgi:hypothetical protein
MRVASLVFERQLLSTLIDFELVQILMRVDQSFRYARGNREFKLHVSGNGKRQVRTFVERFSFLRRKNNYVFQF